MDCIKHLGRGILEVVGPTYQAYGDLLRQPSNASAIFAAKRETFSYGDHPRQQLDLYTPSHKSRSAAGKSPPLLVFAYGGGFVSGDKVVAGIPEELVYTNLGYFFAERLGFETMVIDYRLLSHGAKYPSGGDDIAGVVDWVEARYSSSTESATSRELFILGNSAGAAHCSTWLFEDRFRDRRNALIGGNTGVRLEGVVFLGCPFRWDIEGPMKELLGLYYGGEQETKAAEPTALMEKATEGVSVSDMRKWPKILVAVSEFDPEAMMIVPAKEFAKLWHQRGGRGKFIELKGHNHISPPLSLGTAVKSEEAWGYEVGAWLIHDD